MEEEIFSLALLEALPAKKDELLNTLRELYQLMHAKGYCRDLLCRDAARRESFVHLRWWTSAAMRAEAQIDPDVHRYWQKLPELCTISNVHESLETVFETK